ncbi:MAG: hypothetical protein JNK78_09055 [Planctomycetes bacterium]|nr:hypothetical protein [Planctomycetota bacterium]
MHVPGRPPVMLDIVEEHFDELDFLHEQREGNLFTPDWRLADLAWHEERAEAHLDGLRLAESWAVDIAEPRLCSGETATALAATLVLCADESGAHAAKVIDALRTADPPVVDGIRRALRHGVPATIGPVLRELAAARDPLRAAAAIDVLAFVRTKDVDARPPLDAPVPLAFELAVGAAGRLGALDAADVAAALERAEPRARRAALRAAALAGVPRLAELCRAAATRPTDPDPEALSMLGTLGDAADEAILRAAMQRPELARTAVAALGALGRPTAVPLLIELTRDDDLGVPAALAYQRITGFRDAFGEKPWPRPEIGEGEDENEDLPPAPDAIAADWRRREAHLAKDRTWQFGAEIPPDRLPTSFDELPLHARADVYWRLRGRRVTVPDVELEAMALRQRL